MNSLGVASRRPIQASKALLPCKKTPFQLYHRTISSLHLKPIPFCHPSKRPLGKKLSRQGDVPTASQAGPSTTITQSSTIEPTASANPRFPSPSFQPPYPSPPPISTSSTPDPQVTVTSPTRWSLRNALIGGGNPEFPSPFRSRAGTGGSSIASRPRRPSAARLWNPTNSTPRVYPQSPQQQRPQAHQQNAQTRRRNRSPAEQRTVIAIPLSHPDISSPREEGGAPGEYPLLTLPEQRQKRHSASTRASLQVERSGSSTGTNRVSLPRSVSIDIARKKSGESSPLGGPKLDKGKGRAVEEYELERPKTQDGKKATGFRKRGQSITDQPTAPIPGISFEKGKGKATMATDVERGPATQEIYKPGGTSLLPHNASTTSLPHGIGPALSSTNTSIIGSDGPANAAEEWGPLHPCYPHLNPHVPLSSPLYQTTRIIRIRRDWMLEGDLAPTFSNLYPEILDPAGVTEQEFRTVVERVNAELIPAFNPWGARNILDGLLGLLTGWIWDDMGLTDVKKRLRKVESYLEEWNRNMEAKSKGGEGTAPKIVSLRRTGYMNLDIQVPDPEVAYPISNPGDRTDTGISTQSP